MRFLARLETQWFILIADSQQDTYTESKMTKVPTCNLGNNQLNQGTLDILPLMKKLTSPEPLHPTVT